MDLRQRLALLKQLQGQGAPAAQPAPAPTVAPAPAGKLGLPPEVTEHETEAGPVYWREKFYPASFQYGVSAVGEFPALAPELVALLARDPRLAHVSPAQLAFLDTETTGLGTAAGTVPFLIGIGLWQDGGFLVRQYFMPDYGHEMAMLHHLAATLQAAAGLVSFNGKTFDQPLLTTRYTLNRSRPPLAGAPHLDLLHPARRLWRRRLGDCSLGNLEAMVLAQQRSDDIPGHLIPALYFDYLHHRRGEVMADVLAHNEQDLLALAGIAIHLAAALALSDGAADHPLDRLSLGYWLEAIGRTDDALTCYRDALSTANSASQRREVLRRLGLLQRRLRLHPEAVQTWSTLADEGESVEALVELAKHHEHRSRDLQAALAATERALALARERRTWAGASGRMAQTLAALQHRRDRLHRKLARQSS